MHVSLTSANIQNANTNSSYRGNHRNDLQRSFEETYKSSSSIQKFEMFFIMLFLHRKWIVKDPRKFSNETKDEILILLAMIRSKRSKC